MSKNLTCFNCETCGPIGMVIIEGYGIGDRLLEDIDFLVTVSDDQIFSATLKEATDIDYFTSQGIDLQFWFDRATAVAKENETLICPLCNREAYLEEKLVEKFKT